MWSRAKSHHEHEGRVEGEVLLPLDDHVVVLAEEDAGEAADGWLEEAKAGQRPADGLVDDAELLGLRGDGGERDDAVPNAVRRRLRRCAALGIPPR